MKVGEKAGCLLVVGLVLVGVGLAPAGLLVQRLIVPDADGVHAEEARRRLSHPRVEGEWANVGAVLPEVLALNEGLLVA